MKDVIITITAAQSTEDAADMDTLAEFTTVGQFSHENGSGTIRYVESELTGMEGTLTSLYYTPDGAKLERTGNLVAKMDFSPGVRNTFAYDTPYGSATVGLETLEYRPELTDAGGTLEIEYVVDFEHAMVGVNRMHIAVKEQKDKKEEQA